MNAEQLVTDMRAALAAERDAIRRLDVQAVNEAAATKEKLLGTLKDAPASDRAALVAALGELKMDLRRNLVLLAHARDYLRETVELFGKGRLDAKL